MSDCIWTYSDYRRVYTVELKNRINEKSKIQGSAEVLVAKKVKNITKPTITFPQHVFCLSSQYKHSFIVQFQSYIFLPPDPQKQSFGRVPAYLRSFKSVFQSVCVFSLFSLIPCTDLIVHPPHTTTRSMKGLDITGLKGEKFGGFFCFVFLFLTMAGSDGR